MVASVGFAQFAKACYHIIGKMVPLALRLLIGVNYRMVLRKIKGIWTI